MKMKRRKEIIIVLMLLSLFAPHLAGAQRTWNTGNDLSMCLKSVEEIRLYLAGGDDTPIGPGYFSRGTYFLTASSGNQTKIEKIIINKK